MHRLMQRLPMLAVAVVLVACDKSKPELEKTLAQMQQISAQKDTLIQEVTATSQFIADLNTEMSRTHLQANRIAKNASRGENEDNMSLADRRADMLQKVRELASRMNETEGRLAASRKRVATLAGDDATLKSQLSAYDATLASFKRIMDNQKADLTALAAGPFALDREHAAEVRNGAARRGHVVAQQRPRAADD